MAMYFLIIYVFFLLREVNACHTFQDTLFTAKSNNGEKFNVTITGCAERKSFNGITVVELSAKYQKIPKLENDAVRHLIHLQYLTLLECEIEEIEEGAFRNVPELSDMFLGFNKITNVPNNVFNGLNLKRLIMHHNNISIISDGAFANMSKLVDFSINYNNIQYYNREWFLNSPKLAMINFQYNKLRSVPRKAFLYNKELKQIFLDYNDIDTLQENAFEGLTFLKFLGLSYNRIKVLNIKAFPSGLSIKYLWIGANKLNYLPYELLEKISLQKLTLTGNPWKCPCLDRIVYWMYLNNGTISNTQQCMSGTVPSCSFPKTFSQTCLEIYDEESTKLFFDAIEPSKDTIPEYCVRFD